LKFLLSSTPVPLEKIGWSKFVTNVAGATLSSDVGLGTWQAAPGEVGRAVKVALDTGYRHLDLAYVYCNEKEIGQALQEWFQAHPEVQRKDVWITSKLWNTFHRPDMVMKGLETTLKDLQLDYLDLYLMHWPIAFPPTPENSLSPQGSNGEYLDETHEVTVAQTWKAMEDLVLPSGKVKAIGVSNFTVASLKALLATSTVVPAVNQVELHPYLAQSELLTYCQQQGIHLTAYSPLGSTCTKPNLKEDPVIQSIAQKYNKTPVQILISWAIQRGTSVIPKSVTPARIQANFEIVSLSDEDNAKINQLGTQFQIRTCDCRKFWKIDVFNENHPRL
jgi:diketogulonate reductase-like aldo/keto reductase